MSKDKAKKETKGTSALDKNKQDEKGAETGKNPDDLKGLEAGIRAENDSDTASEDAPKDSKESTEQEDRAVLAKKRVKKMGKKTTIAGAVFLLIIAAIIALVGIPYLRDNPSVELDYNTSEVVDAEDWEVGEIPSYDDVLAHLSEKYDDEFEVIDTITGPDYYHLRVVSKTFPNRSFTVVLKEQAQPVFELANIRDGYQIVLAEELASEVFTEVAKEALGEDNVQEAFISFTVITGGPSATLDPSLTWMPADGLGDLLETDSTIGSLFFMTSAEIILENAATLEELSEEKVAELAQTMLDNDLTQDESEVRLIVFGVETQRAFGWVIIETQVEELVQLD